MKIAYVIGPYRATSWELREANIQRARRVAKEFWHRGYAVICPHTNSAHFDDVADEQVFVEGYITILKCLTPEDLVVVLDGWEQSRGSSTEVMIARKEGIPVLFLTKRDENSFWKGD